MELSKSKIALFICCLTIVLVAFCYYPKWKQNNTEATISWDVSGYYLYLPAIFIYKDVKQVSFLPDILDKYHPTPNIQQVFKHHTGHYVMKYSCGQAIQYLPWFTIGHVWATASDAYPNDGFSYPYQLMISMGSLLVAILGLFFLRKILIHYFEEGIVVIVLVSIVLGTNYLDYSAVNGAMTHNGLFTIYAILIYVAIHLYSNPTLGKSIAIGALIGLASLTRPTEIIACLIPLLWGLNLFSKKAIINRLTFFQKHWKLLAIAIITCASIGFIQLFYWKYATGEWIVYSYEDQGFSWLKPHLYNGFFSYKSGWLTYSPMMVFALLGFYPLYKGVDQLYSLKSKDKTGQSSNAGWMQPLQKVDTNIWSACFLFSILFIYITFAWDIWWYGGSLGQRAMVQAYPILAFPMASFFSWVMRSPKWLKIVLGSILVVFIYYNLWLTHQAHHGGLLRAGNMTKAYFWKVLGTFEKDLNNEKLLDNKEEFIGMPKQPKQLYFNDFEKDSIAHNCSLSTIDGQQSFCLNKSIKSTPHFEVSLTNKQFDWIRASADFRMEYKEWNFWKMTQFTVRFSHKGKKVKENMIRVQRLLNSGETKNIYLDASCPKKAFDKVSVFASNANGKQELLLDNILVIGFKE